MDVDADDGAAGGGKRPRVAEGGSGGGKRAQVQRACTRCASSKRKCSGTFPCERCTRLSLANTCVEVTSKRVLLARGELADECAWSGAAAPARAPVPQRTGHARLYAPPIAAMDGSGGQWGGGAGAGAAVNSSIGAKGGFLHNHVAASVDMLLRASGESDDLGVSPDMIGDIPPRSPPQLQIALPYDEGGGGFGRGGASSPSLLLSRHGMRLLEGRVELSPGVSLSLVSPIAYPLSLCPHAFMPYPCWKATFLDGGGGAATTFESNLEGCFLFGIDRDALPRSPLSAFHWLHPDEVPRRAALADFVRSRRGAYFEWAGTYVRYVMRGGGAGGRQQLQRTASLFTAWERIFVSYHASGATACTMSLFTTIADAAAPSPELLTRLLRSPQAYATAPLAAAAVASSANSAAAAASGGGGGGMIHGGGVSFGALLGHGSGSFDSSMGGLPHADYQPQQQTIPPARSALSSFDARQSFSGGGGGGMMMPMSVTGESPPVAPGMWFPSAGAGAGMMGGAGGMGPRGASFVLPQMTLGGLPPPPLAMPLRLSDTSALEGGRFRLSVGGNEQGRFGSFGGGMCMDDPPPT